MNEDLQNCTKDELISKINILSNRFGLFWQDKPEEVVERCKTELPVLKEVHSKTIASSKGEPTNLIIEGDNYHALSVLNYTHKDRIDVIYIDPPYNTGAKDWRYNNNYVDSEDTYRHSKWLSMMYNRLKIVKSLLTDAGFFVCAIDHHELGHLLILCDELFGESNRIGNIAVVHKPEGRQFSKFFTPSYENMLIYAKNKRLASFNRVALDENVKKTFNLVDDKGRYKLKSCIRTDGDANRYPNRFYPIYVSSDLLDISLNFKKGYRRIFPLLNNSKRIWIRKKESFMEWIKNREVVANEDKDGHVVLKRKYRESEVLKAHWVNTKYNATAYGTHLLSSIIGAGKFDYPKSLYLILDLLKITSKKDSVVLDFFAGSGTTGHAVLDLNKQDGGSRQFILCTNNENKIAEEVTYPRISKVIKGYKDQESLGGNLRYFKTDFVSKSPTNLDLTRKKLMEKSAEIICIKENSFNLVVDETDYKVFNDSKHYCVIIFDTDKIPEVKQYCNELADKLTLHIYIFSFNSDTYASDFVDLKRKFTIIPVPESILEVYQRISKDKKVGI